MSSVNQPAVTNGSSVNPLQAQSWVRSGVLYLLGAGAAVLVTKGVMTSDQTAALMPGLATLIITAGGIAVAKWGANSHSAPALVAAVNSDIVPGVKVVAAAAQAPQVIVTATGRVVPDPKPGA